MPDTILKNRNFVSLTCINSPIASVCKDIEDILNKHGFKLKVIMMNPHKTSFTLPDQQQSKSGFVLWEPKNADTRCAFMATIYDGWYTLIRNIATKYKHDCSSIRVSSMAMEYPICELQCYVNGDHRRLIRIMKDGPRWDFFTMGTPLSFEKTENYKKRRIKDRFTEELLLEYLLIQGWDIKGNNFWETSKPYYRVNLNHRTTR